MIEFLNQVHYSILLHTKESCRIILSMIMVWCSESLNVMGIRGENPSC